jgi:hypothetical protein
MPLGAVAEGSSHPEDPGRPPGQIASWADELCNALAWAFFAAVYALLLGGLFRLVPPAPAGALLRGFAAGYGLAVLVFVAAHVIAGCGLRLARPNRRAAVHLLTAPLASLIACGMALPRLFQAPDLAALVSVAAFLGGGAALSAAHDFYAGIQRQLVPARRVRDFLAARPAIGRFLFQWILPLLQYGRLLPWLVGAVALLAFPPSLRSRAASYLFLIVLLAYALNRKLLEELAVWVFLHALRVGDYLAAARIPVRPSRLTAEIAARPADLEAPFARFIAYGMQGPEGLTLTPTALGRLVPVHLAAYGLTARGGEWEGSAPSSPLTEPFLVRRLLDRGMRFRMESEPSAALEPLPLPRWSELWRAEARARLAALYPGEPLWQVIARHYETPIRGILLPLSLLWLPLPGLALAVWSVSPLAEEPPSLPTTWWALPLAGAALSFLLLVWLTLFYSNWIFDQSLRRHDFECLARQLGQTKMRGELEDALGSPDPLVRDRAVELLLFDNDIACLGITVPPAGLRKFLRRAG